MGNDSSRRVLSVKEAAERLDVAPDTLYRWIARGEFPAVKIGNGPRPTVKIPVDRFEEWLEARSTGAGER